MLLCLGELTSSGANAADRAGRVSQGLQVFYTFDRLENGVIPDRAGTGEPLPLRIDQPENVSFRSGRMTVNSSLTMTTDGPARRLAAAIKTTNELTIEAWLRPLEVGQGGPAPIVSLSVDPSHRNFTLGQDKSRYDFRLRTSKTDENGNPSTPGPENMLTTQLTHVACARAADGAVRLFVDGKLVASNTVAGDLSHWSDEFQLSVANEVTGDRPWLADS